MSGPIHFGPDICYFIYQQLIAFVILFANNLWQMNNNIP